MVAVEKSGDEELAKGLPLEQHPRRAERLAIIDKLIAAGADIMVKWRLMRRSLLLRAVEDRDVEIAKRLVNAGADPRAEDEVGNRRMSPLYLAERRGEPLMLEALSRK